MPTAAAMTHSVNSSREPVLRHLPEHPGKQAPPDHQHQHDERADLREA